MHDSDYGSNDYDDGHDDGNDKNGPELLQSHPADYLHSRHGDRDRAKQGR